MTFQASPLSDRKSAFPLARFAHSAGRPGTRLHTNLFLHGLRPRPFAQSRSQPTFRPQTEGEKSAGNETTFACPVREARWTLHARTHYRLRLKSCSMLKRVHSQHFR